MSSWVIYPVDAGLAALCISTGASIFLAFPPGELVIATVAALALFAVGALLAYAGSGTAIWLSLAHNAQHSTERAGARTSLRHRRSVGRALPCPYPDAWYAVALSAELPPGAIVDAVVCGRSLVVFRPPAGGLPTVLDGYCSHNGAHLAHGGSRLVGDCIRCPFHGWCFDSKGRAVSTGVGDKPPPGSDLRAWPVLERNGVVSVWMEAAGHAPAKPKAAAAVPPEADRLPPPAPALPWWEPPAFPELNGGGYVYHGCSEHIVPALIYELPENGAGEWGGAKSRRCVHSREPTEGAAVSLGLVQTSSTLRSCTSRSSSQPCDRYSLCVEGEVWSVCHRSAHLPPRKAQHKWAAEWTPDPDRPHIANLKVVESMALCGGRGGMMPGPVHVNVTQCGISQVRYVGECVCPRTRRASVRALQLLCSRRGRMGQTTHLGTHSQVSLNFRVPGIGRLFIIETVTPVAPTVQRVLHAVYAQPHIPRLIAKAILASTIRAYEQARVTRARACRTISTAAASFDSRLYLPPNSPQDVPVWAHKRYEPAPRLTEVRL